MKLLYFLFIFSFTQTALSQNYCGTVDTEFDEWISRLDKFGINRNPTTQLKSGNTLWVPMHYHIMRRTNGTGQYFQYWVMIMNCELNEAYARTNLRFYIDKISYHNTDEYYGVKYGKDAQLAAVFDTKKHCNVYLTDDPAGNCGYTRRPTGNGPEYRFPIFLKASATNYSCCQPGAKTLPHEMGHWLDLPHTFFRWEGLTYNTVGALSKTLWEAVARKGDSANCSYRGDGFCDTEPDYISDRWNCPSNKIFLDPYGKSFTPVGWNYMSYADDACIASNGFSVGQMNVMNFTYKYPDRRDLYELPPPTEKNVDSVKKVYPESSITKRQIKKGCKIVFEPVDSADFYQITIARGGATLNTNYIFSQTQFNSYIVDTIISAALNYLEIPEARLNGSTNDYYYYRVIPFTKTNSCPQKVMKANYFRVSSVELDVIAQDISCSGMNDGSIEIVNKLNTPGLTYRYNGSNFNSRLENLGEGIHEIEVTESNGTISQIYCSLMDYGKAKFKLEKDAFEYKVSGTNGKLPYTYRWSGGSTEESAPISTDITSVTVKDAYGCDSTIFKLSDISNSIQNLEASDMEIQPNPIGLGEKVHFKLPTPLKEYSCVSVYNAIGELLFQTNLKVNSSQKDVELNWIPKSKGIYIVKIQSNSSSHYAKLLVE